MSTPIKLDRDERGKKVDEKMHRGMISCLLYLIVSRPDIICWNLCSLSSFPKDSHLNAVEWILKYPKGTIALRLWYPKNITFVILGYCDAGFIGCLIERKVHMVLAIF